MDLVRILQSSTLFHSISEQEIPHLLNCLQSRTVTFPKEYTIIDEGELSEELGIVISGGVHIVRHDFWGNRSLVVSVGVGESFAEALSCTQLPSEVSVITTELSSILFLNAHTLITSCERGCIFHHTLIDNMVKLLSLKNLELMKKINHLTKRSTREKLLSYLLAESRKHRSCSFTIPYDRQQLADYLCVERSAMSAELSRMQQDGLLEYTRSTFTLHQEESL